MGTSTIMDATSTLAAWFAPVKSMIGDFVTDIIGQYLPFEVVMILLVSITGFLVYALLRLVRPGGKR
jgi:hypothetical protein